MQDIRLIDIQITPEQQGTYFTVPFAVPEGVEVLHLKYSYLRRYGEEQFLGRGKFDPFPEVNIVDLGLIAPDGTQVGASGSDKSEIYVSETSATPGYRPYRIIPGEWKILVGAYKIDRQGVSVGYEIRMDHKWRRLFKGDLHTHTLASDGVHTLDELADKAKRHGLDFIAVTDHNQMISQEALPSPEGVTMIPGVEWTHYQGHANFLGVDRPFDGAFATHTAEEALNLFATARQRGAVITINHPFEENMGFQFDMKTFPFDCLEIWNGPMRESNLRSVGLWHHLLCQGMKLPACGGSDYHRDTPFIFLGGPTMCLFAESSGPSDILAALKAGHGYITFAPNGPALSMSAGEAIMGDTVAWDTVKDFQLSVEGLLAGDVVQVVTAQQSETLFKAPSDGNLTFSYTMKSPGFARVEVLRAFLPALPMLPALISNPIYFTNE